MAGPAPNCRHGAPTKVSRCGSLAGEMNINQRVSPVMAVYLLRPDTYVALAASGGTADVLARYFADHRIRPASSR